MLDELALEFSDAFIVEERFLDDAVRSVAAQLDWQLEEMSGAQHRDLWTVEALKVSEEWARVRKLAAEILRRNDEVS